VIHVVFGDLFLEDIRAYRDKNLAAVGMTAIYPLWGRNTKDLATAMLASGIEAHITCVDPRAIAPECAGQRWDEAFIGRLGPGVDPCGENGEFHTFVSAGPMFAEPIPTRGGDIVERDGFVFADLLPA